MKKKKGLEQSLTFFFLDCNGGFLSDEFPDVCCVWFGSISVTANMWHGLQAVWDLGVLKSLYCKSGFTGIMLQNWLAAFSFFCVLSSCIVCCSVCISCCLCSVSCRLTKWEGLCLIHSWVFTEFWSVHCSHLNYTLVQLRQCSCLKMAANIVFVAA